MGVSQIVFVLGRVDLTKYRSLFDNSNYCTNFDVSIISGATHVYFALENFEGLGVILVYLCDLEERSTCASV